MTVSKKALAKAYDAGQAAQVRGLPDEVNPFDPLAESEEHEAYLEGKNSELADKWKAGPLGALHVELGN